MLCSPPRLCCYRDSKYTIEEVGAKLQTLDQRHGASLLHTSITPLPNDNPVRVRDVRQLPPVLDDRAVHRAGVPALAVLLRNAASAAGEPFGTGDVLTGQEWILATDVGEKCGGEAGIRTRNT